MKSILVTGATGFIGSALVIRIESMGFEVIQFGSVDGDISDINFIEEYENRKMIICEHKNMPIGFCVESVTDILNISHNNIHDEKSSDTLFESILHLNNGERIVMLFDLERVLKESA